MAGKMAAIRHWADHRCGRTARSHSQSHVQAALVLPYAMSGHAAKASAVAELSLLESVDTEDHHLAQGWQC